MKSEKKFDSGTFPFAFPFVRLTLTAASTVLIVLAFASQASAQCTDWSNVRCRRDRLQAVDREMNAEYGRLVGGDLPGERIQRLRAEQRAWIGTRNSTCEVPASVAARKDWIQELAKDRLRSMCVIGATEQRTRNLREVRMAQVNELERVHEVKEHYAPVVADRGKWYAEVDILVSEYWHRSPAALEVGLRGPKVNYTVNLKLDRSVKEGSRKVVGLAFDLDEKRFYPRVDGRWSNGKPGDRDGGYALQDAGDYGIFVKSSGSIGRQLKNGGIRLNFGAERFEDLPPEGYAPFYVDAANREDPVNWIVPTYELTHEQARPAWVMKYWGWLLSAPVERHPAKDYTGERCAERQSGPVWFLAGADAVERVERRCTVPSGTHLLLPLFAYILVERKDDVCNQKKLWEAAEDGAEAISNAHVVINGKRFAGFRGHLIHTTACTTVKGPDGSVIAPQTVFWGNWVILRPLPPGEHSISFGADLNAINSSRGVTYRITVR